MIPFPAPTRQALILADGENIRKSLQVLHVQPWALHWDRVAQRVAGAGYRPELCWFQVGGLHLCTKHSLSAHQRDWLATQEARLARINRRLMRLTQAYDAFRVVHKGVLRVHPATRRYLGEKGVDVAIGIAMLQAAQSGRYQRLILMSGDQDFIEAIREVQALGVEVWVVDIQDRQGRSTALSAAVARQADKVVRLRAKELQAQMALPVAA